MYRTRWIFQRNFNLKMNNLVRYISSYDFDWINHPIFIFHCFSSKPRFESPSQWSTILPGPRLVYGKGSRNVSMSLYWSAEITRRWWNIIFICGWGKDVETWGISIECQSYHIIRFDRIWHLTRIHLICCNVCMYAWVDYVYSVSFHFIYIYIFNINSIHSTRFIKSP